MENESNIEDDFPPSSRLNQLTEAIIGAAIEVHRALGPGHLESTYESALAIEFGLRNIPFKRQFPIAVNYKGSSVGESRLDFLVFDEIILELKSVETIAPIHRAIVISYLNISNKKLALIINFRVKTLKDGIRRIAN